ncbi:DUF3077 domain-containing protein [Pseudomonas putida]|nr:DUF3077 domain-containing protein [Pseudomonas putida]
MMGMNTQFTVGKTTFYQGENGTYPSFRIEPGVPCQDARDQSSALMGYERQLTMIGLMDETTPKSANRHPTHQSPRRQSDLVKICAIFRARDFPAHQNRSLTCKQPNHSTTIPSTGPNASGQHLSCQ